MCRVIALCLLCDCQVGVMMRMKYLQTATLLWSVSQCHKDDDGGTDAPLLTAVYVQLYGKIMATTTRKPVAKKKVPKVNLRIPANRFRQLMEMIPREPGRIKTTDLCKQLARMGHFTDSGNEEANRRSLQNNLKKIWEADKERRGDTSYYGLKREKVGKDYEYFFEADAPVHITPSLNSDMALALLLAELYLVDLMPPQARESLAPIFSAAENALVDREARFARGVDGRVLSRVPLQGKIGKRKGRKEEDIRRQMESEREEQAAAHWKNKVHEIPFGVRRQGPKVNEEIRATVYRAVMEDKPLRIKYATAEKKPGEFLVKPWGLIFRNQDVYLAWHGSDKPGTYPFALHRIREANIAEVGPEIKFFSNPKWSTLKDYAEHEFAYFVAKKGERREIDLKLRIMDEAKWLVTSLEESPLIQRQRLEHDPDDSTGNTTLLSATVQNTQELRYWIRSLGKAVEVLEPPSLRKEMADEVAKLAQMYPQK